MPDRDLQASWDPGWPAPRSVETGFLASRHGFAFPNTWHDMFLGVIASRGRCGGMVFAALDHFYAGETVPLGDNGGLPDHDSGLARYILRRQVASVTTGLGVNLWRFVLMTYLPTHLPGGIAEVTRRELGPLLDALSAGRPVPLGLVSSFTPKGFFRNHQVLATGVVVDGDRALVRVYDPNHPRRDDVLVEVPRDPAEPVLERVGSRTIPWRGFFIERYRPVRVSAQKHGSLMERAVSAWTYWAIGGVLLLAVWAIRSVLRGSAVRRSAVRGSSTRRNTAQERTLRRRRVR